MTTDPIQLDDLEHVAHISFDDRKRAPLGRYAARGHAGAWRLYRLNDGKVLVLEAIEGSDA